MKTRVLVAALLLPVCGCHYQPWPVRLQGSSSEITGLAGEWVGEYSSAQSRRSGSIIFRLAAGRDTAFGDVLMINSRGTAGVSDPSSDHTTRAPSSELLRITFVRIAGGRVEGALAPYTEPECRCTASTTFTGNVSTDVIEGTFVTRDESGREQSGRWRVARKSR